MRIPFSTSLITRARNGNLQAIKQIYERWHIQIYRYILYRTGNVVAAEDLTSEVFLKVMNALPDFTAAQPNNEEKSLRGWIFQIARHALVDYYRKNNRRKTVALNDQILMDSVPLEHTIERALTIDQLKSALLGLPEDQREALILRFILGFSISEAADTMRRSEDSIKGLQRRALQTLRVSLAHLE